VLVLAVATDAGKDWRAKSRCGGVACSLAVVALWFTETPDGRTVIGEAANKAEAFRMIENQQHSQARGSVTWHEGRGNAPGRWRWTAVLHDGKTSHGWADDQADAWQQVEEALNRHKVVWRVRGPRLRWELKP
jgi:hypothetical protein